MGPFFIGQRAYDLGSETLGNICEGDSLLVSLATLRHRSIGTTRMFKCPLIESPCNFHIRSWKPSIRSLA
jgi:hypothetical protein